MVIAWHSAAVSGRSDVLVCRSPCALSSLKTLHFGVFRPLTCSHSFPEGKETFAATPTFSSYRPSTILPPKGRDVSWSIPSATLIYHATSGCFPRHPDESDHRHRRMLAARPLMSFVPRSTTWVREPGCASSRSLHANPGLPHPAPYPPEVWYLLRVLLLTHCDGPVSCRRRSSGYYLKSIRTLED